MLVNATEMLIKARDGHYGVPQFNINNLEWTKSVLTACEEMKSPVILGVSEGAGKYMTGFKTVAAMVDAMVDSMGITVPVALHLDHGTYEGCKACIEAGKDLQGKGFDPRKLLAPGAKAIEDKCKEKIELFGCAGKG